VGPKPFDVDQVAVLDGYARNGFHIEPDVFDTAFCDRLIDAGNRFPAIRRGDFRTVLQPHRQDGAFLDALRHPSVTRIVRSILGDEISGIQSQFFYCRAGTPGFQAHQDNRFVNAPRGAFASAWVALVDVGPLNGGLIIYPGSHREPLLEVQEVQFQESPLQDTNAIRLRCAIPDGYEPFDIDMKKGSAAFFDGHTIHASHANRSTDYRYALLLTYVRKGVSFTAGRYAQREVVAIESS
jgi:phytanoyl-CoA hydroxylase